MRSLGRTSSYVVFHRPNKTRFLRTTYFHARSLSTSPSWIDESFHLRVGNNGSISLSVTRPVAASLPAQGNARSQGSNVILYLPPGPLFQAPADPIQAEGKPEDSAFENRNWSIDSKNSSGLSPQHTLASTASATVVTVNYRLGAVWPTTTTNEESSQNSTSTLHSSSPSESQSQSQPQFYKYPTPIHDTLTAFDWIHTHLRPAQLGVIGSHIGGSLALMLALTEAQSVKAVASIMPVCDWPGLDEYCTIEQLSASTNASHKPQGKPNKRASKKKSHRATAPSDLVPLLAAREAFFSSPERCFDAFASPILFLRSAGRDVPRAFPEYMSGPEHAVPVLKHVRESTGVQHGALDGSLSDQEINSLNSEAGELSEVEAGHATVRRRKALSRWPPYGLDYGAGGGRGWGGNGVRRLQVTLPWVKVYVDGAEGEGKGTVLADQGEEMVSVIRRACFFGREKGVGERRVSLVRDFGGLGSRLGEVVGGWFGGIFDGRIGDE